MASTTHETDSNPSVMNDLLCPAMDSINHTMHAAETSKHHYCRPCRGPADPFPPSFDWTFVWFCRSTNRWTYWTVCCHHKWCSWNCDWWARDHYQRPLWNWKIAASSVPRTPSNDSWVHLCDARLSHAQSNQSHCTFWSHTLSMRSRDDAFRCDWKISCRPLWPSSDRKWRIYWADGRQFSRNKSNGLRSFSNKLWKCYSRALAIEEFLGNQFAIMFRFSMVILNLVLRLKNGIAMTALSLYVNIDAK